MDPPIELEVYMISVLLSSIPYGTTRSIRLGLPVLASWHYWLSDLSSIQTIYT